MDHEVATRTHAVERYLLSEMPAEEREDFEEHYFSCEACAGDVRAGAEMRAEMRRALREGIPTRDWWSWWRSPQMLVPTCAAMFLGAVVAYQNTVVLPELKAPQPMGAAVILDGQTRGLTRVAAADPLRFQLPMDGVESCSRVAVALENAEGHTVETGNLPVPPAHQPLDIYFPGRLGPGRYRVVVREDPGGKELANTPFEITDKETTSR